MKRIVIALFAMLMLSASAFAATKHMTNTNTNTMSYAPAKQYNIYGTVTDLIDGRLSVAFDYKLNNRWTIGPQARYYLYGSVRGYHIGATANWSLPTSQKFYSLSSNVLGNRVWLLNPYIEYAHSDVRNTSKSKKSGVEMGVNLAYQWMWNNGFNVRAFAGPIYSSLEPLIAFGHSHLNVTGGITLGYAF